MALTGLLISTHLERGHVASVDSSADTDLNISVLLWSVTGGAGAHFHFHLTLARTPLYTGTVTVQHQSVHNTGGEGRRASQQSENITKFYKGTDKTYDIVCIWDFIINHHYNIQDPVSCPELLTKPSLYYNINELYCIPPK